MMNQQVIQKFLAEPLIEAMQYKKLRYALAKPTEDGGFEAITPYVLCRDYLKDLLYCKFVTKKGIGDVYGFDTNKFKLDDIVTEKTLLILTGAKDLIDNIEENWPMLVEREAKHGAIPTEATRFETPHYDGIIIEGDPRWQNSLLGFSYYTFLFRWMTYKNLQVNYSDDNALANNANKLTNRSIDEINQFGFVETKVKHHLYNLHNYFGLLYVNKNQHEIPNCDVSPYAALAD